MERAGSPRASRWSWRRRDAAPRAQPVCAMSSVPADFMILRCCETLSNFILKTATTGFPGGAVVENLPANAGDPGSSPGLGRSPMPRSNYAREPQLLSLRVWSLCSATREAATVRGLRTVMKSGPRLPQLEKALARNEDPTQPKINK